MTLVKLVRHPAPFLTESLSGYALRLSELNGYSSPRSVYHLAGMKTTETSPTSFAFAKLAAVSNQPPSKLEQIALNPKGADSREFYVLGKRVSSTYLNLTAARVCPECVADKGFIEAHWHIDVMVACPVHERAAVWFCGQCKRRVSWIRSGLLTCKCGASLSVPLGEKYSETELWLLDLIRYKALGAAPHRSAHASLPGAQLASTSLQSLLSLIRFLGEQRLRARRSSKRPSGRNLLKAAASLLEDWPSNIQRHLRNISSHPSDNEPFALSLDVDSLREAISQRFASRPNFTNSLIRTEPNTRFVEHHQLLMKLSLLSGTRLGQNVDHGHKVSPGGSAADVLMGHAL